MKAPQPFIISGPDVLGEILRRNQLREQARRLGIPHRVHIARLGEREIVESNLPIPHSAIRNPKSP